MNMGVSPYILELKFLFKDTFSTMTAEIHVNLFYSKSQMLYLSKKACLVIILRNTTHPLDMFCCHKHQQQRYQTLET